jgi:hypothetical protein
MAEHADFVFEYAAAVKARDQGKISELKSAVAGSEWFCKVAKEKIGAHAATHRPRHPRADAGFATPGPVQ